MTAQTEFLLDAEDCASLIVPLSHLRVAICGRDLEAPTSALDPSSLTASNAPLRQGFQRDTSAIPGEALVEAQGTG